jgi:hypothetical protein
MLFLLIMTTLTNESEGKSKYPGPERARLWLPLLEALILTVLRRKIAKRILNGQNDRQNEKYPTRKIR